MKVMGKSKKGHTILVVTEFELKIIQEALFESVYNCEQFESPTEKGSMLNQHKMIQNRFYKELNKFDSLPIINNVKKLIE